MTNHSLGPAAPFIPIAVLVAILPGCDASPGGAGRAGVDGFELSDSAGIEIVYNAAPAWTEDQAWSIDPQPMLQIGQITGESAYQFSQIWDAARFDDGRIVVSEASSNEIRVFGADGTHFTTFGGRGGGPGEFAGPPWLRAVSPDTLVVWDAGHLRLSWFSPEGALLDEASLDEVIREFELSRLANGLVWGLGRDGSVLSTGSAASAGRPGLGLYESAWRAALIGDRGATVQELGTFPAQQNFFTQAPAGMLVGIGHAWSPSATAAIIDEPLSVAIGGAGGWEVRIAGSDGVEQRILRADIPRIPVTSEIIQAERETRLVDMAPRLGITLSQAQDAFDQLPLPDSVPAIGAIEADANGHLWVGRRTELRREVPVYDVFDRNGRWLGPVAPPSDIDRILEIGDEHLLATWRDDLNVPYLRIYGITKPGRGQP